MKTMQNFKVVGTNAHRVDAIEKVSGKAIYTSDIQLPGMAHARILRSPVAHAKLIKVDASKAKELPGVIATLTRDDIQGFNFKYGATYKDQSIVAVDKVRYVGDPVAAVLADTPEIAEQALELIEVEYEELAKGHQPRRGHRARRDSGARRRGGARRTARFDLRRAGALQRHQYLLLPDLRPRGCGQRLRQSRTYFRGHLSFSKGPAFFSRSS